MADFTLIREEGHGYARRLVIRLPEYAWKLGENPLIEGEQVQVQVLENKLISPEERV